MHSGTVDDLTNYRGVAMVCCRLGLCFWNNHDHANAQIKCATHVLMSELTLLGQQVKHGRHLPAVLLNLYAKAVGKHSWDIFL